VALQHERQPGRPASALLIQALDLLHAHRGQAGGCDRHGFVEAQLEVVPIDGCHVLVRDQSGIAVRRIAPAHDQQHAVGWDFGDRVSDQSVERVFGVDLLVVVEHDGGAVGQQAEQLTKKSAREPRHVVLVLRGEQRERLAVLAGERPARLSQVVEERRQIGVTWVYLVPDATNLAAIQPCRHHGRLACARRAHDADCRLAPSCLVQPVEQPLSLYRLMKARSGELCERAGWPRHNSTQDSSPESTPTGYPDPSYIPPTDVP